MNADVLKVIGLIGVVIVLGIILKDAQQFNTVIQGSSQGVTSLIGQLQKSG